MPGPNAATQARAAEKAVRVQRALELRTAGLTNAQISDEIGVDERTARRYVQEALALLAKHTEHDAANLRALELERLDKLQRAAERVLARRHVKVSGNGLVICEGKPLEDDAPTLRAIETLVKISESRRKLLGIDAPTKVEHSGEVDTFVQVIRLPEGIPEP